MARDWENWLQSATKPASNTEEADRDRTEQRIRDAVRNHQELRGNVQVFVKGSYANNTNVRRDSDVDIAVEWTATTRLTKVNDAADLTWDDLGVKLVDYAPSGDDLRGWVEEAMTSAFGSSAVDMSGNKAITVAGGSGTLDADVVPCFRHKRYDGPAFDPHVGILLEPVVGGSICNWPEQNHDNGVSKNNATGRRYKQIIRVLKHLENDMVLVGLLPAEVHGYFIECLLYNLPDEAFVGSTYKQTLLNVLILLWGAIEENEHEDWTEVNGLKWLWRSGQSWTAEEASNFAYTGWKYLKGD